MAGDEAPVTVRPELNDKARAWLESEESEAFGRWLAAQVEQDPNHPEWLDMFAAVLEGSQLGPGEGWFRVATPQTKHTWPELSKRYDQDGNGQIAKAEFPGTEADFNRLDRDHDGSVTETDTAWPEHALAPSPGAMLFSMSDADGDGRVTREELDTLFRQTDSDSRGFLSQDDLRKLLPMPTMRPPAPAGGAARREGGPTKATLIQGLFRQEIGALKPGPKVGEPAPLFALQTAKGDREVSLAEELKAGQPVVLVFGNITCGPFRSQAGNVQKVYERYKDRARFIMVYVREAHPTDGWHMASNDRQGVSLPQPSTFEERGSVARTCQELLDFDMPFVVDTIDDEVGSTFSGMPSRLYVIDPEGVVAYKSGRGPFGFKPAEMEQALIWTLAEKPASE